MRTRIITQKLFATKTLPCKMFHVKQIQVLFPDAEAVTALALPAMVGEFANNAPNALSICRRFSEITQGDPIATGQLLLVSKTLLCEVFHVKHCWVLFPDAKAAKYLTQQVVGRKFTSNAVKRTLGLPQLLSKKFGVIQLPLGIVQMVPSPGKRLQMPCTRHKDAGFLVPAYAFQ
jgi:hypothetical protein